MEKINVMDLIGEEDGLEFLVGMSRLIELVQDEKIRHREHKTLAFWGRYV